MGESESTILPNLDNQTLLDYRNQGIFTDVIFEVNGERFPAHKIVLGSRSDVFKAMFTSGMMESSSKSTIMIEDVDADTFSAFLDYIYNGDSCLVERKPFELIFCADKYYLQPLLFACDMFFIKHISMKNLCDYLDLLETLDRPKVMDCALQFARQRIGNIANDETVWSRLMGRFDFLTKLVDSFSKFLVFKRFNFEPNSWAHRGGKTLSPKLDLVCNGNRVSLELELVPDARGECLLGTMHLRTEVSSSVVCVMLDLMVELDGEVLCLQQSILSWQPEKGVEFWMIHGNEWQYQVGSTNDESPLVLICPCPNIFESQITITTALTSLRSHSPPVHTNIPLWFFQLDEESSHRSSSKINPSLQRSYLVNVITEFLNFRQQSALSCRLENSSNRWKFDPRLTVDSAPKMLCNAVEFEGKDVVLNFMKFNAHDIISCGDWAVMKTRPDLIKELLIQMASCCWFHIKDEKKS